MASPKIPKTVAGSGARRHAEVVAEVLLRCGSRGDCRLWPNQTGVGRAVTSGNIIRFGLVGSSDILGLTNDGRILCLEIKTGAGAQTKPQRQFQDMIERFSGRYAVVRSADEAHAYLESLALQKRFEPAPTDN